jgi:hypothetical protein
MQSGAFESGSRVRAGDVYADADRIGGPPPTLLPAFVDGDGDLVPDSLDNATPYRIVARQD